MRSIRETAGLGFQNHKHTMAGPPGPNKTGAKFTKIPNLHQPIPGALILKQVELILHVTLLVLLEWALLATRSPFVFQFLTVVGLP